MLLCLHLLHLLRDPHPFFSLSSDGEINPSWPYQLNQLTINDYPPGSGIGSHVDTHSAFEDGIASLSLGSSSVMVFIRQNGTILDKGFTPEKVVKALFLPRRSLVMMTGESRYLWSHGIPFRKEDEDEAGETQERDRRISLTYRTTRGKPCCCDYPSYVCDSRS